MRGSVNMLAPRKPYTEMIAPAEMSAAYPSQDDSRGMRERSNTATERNPRPSGATA
jgi:hypothetical protein